MKTQPNKQVAKDYIKYLDSANLKALLSLFSKDAVVYSPVYGKMSATDFYTQLFNDTNNSQLQLKSIFSDENSSSLAIYFDYIWTLKNNTKVEFEVVDILHFNNNHKITELKIIYDTVISRRLVKGL